MQQFQLQMILSTNPMKLLLLVFLLLLVLVGSTSDTAIGTIIDNDPPPTISIDNVTVVEGVNAVFTVSLSNPSSWDTVITIATTTGTADTSDYNTVNTTVTIPAGVTTLSVSVPTIDDTMYELSEDFSITGNVTSGNTSNTVVSATGTITDNDAKPTVSIANVTVIEGVDAVFMVNLSNPSSIPTVMDIVTISGTAGTLDYTAVTTTVTIAPGITTTTVIVPTIDDTMYELSEEFSIAANITSGNTNNPSTSATGTITDNDNKPTVSIDNVTVDEGVAAVFTVNLSNPSSFDTVMTIVTTSGTADISDYTTVSTTITIPAGTTATTVSVPTNDDAMDELIEFFNITTTVISGVTNNLNAFATGTIIDNDDTPTVSIADVIVDEGLDAVFTITLSNPSSVDTILTFVTTAGTADTSDYTTINTSVFLPAGTISVKLSGVPTTDDTIDEPMEYFNITAKVTSGNTSNSTIAATGTIIDNDAPPTVSIANVTVVEGLNAIFTVSLSNPSSLPTVIDIVTASGTADTSDYADVTTTVTIAPGEMTATVSVPTIDDTMYELSEYFNITANVTSGNTSNIIASATGTITDNDLKPIISIANVTVVEGLDAIFTVSLSNPSSEATVITIVTTTGTANTLDYMDVITTITINPGETTATVSVQTIDDTTYELSEYFNITANVTSGSTNNLSASATGIITDNDNKPTVSIANVTVNEGLDAVFTVSLSNPSSLDTVIDVATISGTADTSDYTTINTTVTISAGATAVTISIPTTDDIIDEPNEDFSIIASVTGGNTSNTTVNATGTILDDDAIPSVSIVATDPSATENIDSTFDPGLFTLRLSNPISIVTEVQYTVSGTATSGLDYTAVGASIVIPANTTLVTIPVSVLDDNLLEGNETVVITLNSTNNPVTIGSPSTATVTIADDPADVATVSVVASLPNASEGTPAVDGAFTFMLSNPSGAATTVTYTVTGTAVNGTDYTAITTTIDIPAGGTSVSLPIAVLNDIIFEGSENVIVTITGTTNSLGTVLYDTTPATVTIADDAADVATVSVVASLPNASEGTPAVDGAFTFMLSNPSGAATTVTYTVTGTAVNGTDYTAITTTIDIPAGGTSVGLPIAVLNDIIFEGSENVIVTITGTTNSLGTVLYDTTPATVDHC